MEKSGGPHPSEIKGLDSTVVNPARFCIMHSINIDGMEPTYVCPISDILPTSGGAGYVQYVGQCKPLRQRGHPAQIREADQANLDLIILLHWQVT